MSKLGRILHYLVLLLLMCFVSGAGIVRGVPRSEQRPEHVEFVNLDRIPAIISQPPIEYPEAARKAGIEGKVLIRVLVNEQGRPERAQIIRRAPEDCTIFDDSATSSVMDMRFAPVTKSGNPIRYWMNIPVRYTLQGPAGTDPFQGYLHPE